MKIKFQVLDADYFMFKNKPVIRIFGKTEDNRTITVFYEDFFPYFYAEPKASIEEIEKFLKEHHKDIFLKIYTEKKFRPIGYSSKPTEMVKIVLREPARVPEVRESLKKSGLVKKTYEADIPFKYRFMADFDLGGMKWFWVIGEGINHTEIVNTDLKIHAKDFKETEDVHGVEYKYLSFDIEVVSSDGKLPTPEKDPVAIISIAFNPPYKGKETLVLVRKKLPNKNDIMSFESEKEMLEAFLDIIRDYDPDFITGFNINGFDIPYIVTRLKKNGIPRTFGRCKDKNAISKKISENRYRNYIPGRVIVDVYDIVKDNAQKGMLKLKRYGLNDVAYHFLGEHKVDISHSEIPKYWNGTLDMNLKLVEYARKDAVLALKILLKAELLDKYIAVSKVCGLLLQDVLDGGESQRIEMLLLREFNRRNFVIPNKPDNEEVKRRIEERKKRELTGAVVLDPEVGLHQTSVVYMDFKSLYPSIMITYNICPTTYVLDEKPPENKLNKSPFGSYFVKKDVREGIIPNIVRKLIEERDKVKKKMKKEKDKTKKKILYNKQLALKLVANAFYGYTGYIRAKLYVLDVANSITSYGRYWITTIRNLIHSKTPYKVVYGDTDSVMVKLPVKDIKKAFEIGKELENLVNSITEGAIRIKIEGVFKSILFLTKKRYAGYMFEDPDGEGEIVSKGIETVRRDWCELVGETLQRVLEIILIEGNTKKAFEYVKGIIDKLNRNEIDIDKLVITKSISKPLNEYKGVQPHVQLVKKLQKRNPLNAPGVGDRIGFVIVKGVQKIADRAEDPEYVKKNKIPIDSKYYIENQLMPPLERIFSAIGITKSEFISGAKQMSITQLLKPDVKKDKNNVVKFIPYNELEGFMCIKCHKVYRQIPLNGKCYECGGDIVFYSKNNLSKFVIV